MELPRGHEKDGNAIWNTPAAEDHNITCLLYVLGTWLKLSWTWTVVELFLNLLSWSSGSSVLAFSVPLCLCACYVVVWCACLTASGTALWSFLDGLAVQDIHSQASSSGSPFCRTGRSYTGSAIWCNCNLNKEDCTQWSSDSCGTRCAFICGLIAVCCTKRIASIFKDLEWKNSIYVRYAFSVDDCTLGLFLEKGLPRAQWSLALGW